MGKMKDRYMDQVEACYFMGCLERSAGWPRTELKDFTEDKEMQEAYDFGYYEGYQYPNVDLSYCSILEGLNND